MANKGMVIPPQLMGWWDCITQLMEDSEVMVTPPVILHFIRIFHYKSTILLWTVTFKDDSGWLVSAEGDTKQPPGYRSGRNSSRLSAPWLAKWTLRWGRAVLHELYEGHCVSSSASQLQVLKAISWAHWSILPKPWQNPWLAAPPNHLGAFRGIP